MRLGILSVLLCVAAVTQPTKPTGEGSFEAAREAVVNAKELARTRCYATVQYKAAAADREEKRHALESTRRDGSPEERLNASSAFVKADQAAKKIEADAVANDKGIAEAEERLAVITSNEREKQRTAAAAKEASEYRRLHEGFFDAQDLLRKLKSDEADPAGDDYARYSSRTGQIIAAINALTGYFQQDSLKWKSSEYVALLQDGNVLFNRWKRSLKGKEDIYPSADAARDAFQHLDVASKLALAEQFAVDAKREESRDVASAAISSREALNMATDADNQIKAASAASERARRLLETREGTTPALPPQK